MLTFLFGGFGLSVLWLIPLLWRGARVLMRGRQKARIGGEGAIRFWLGGLLVLLSSATLEGLIVDHYTDDASVGGTVCRLLSAGFSSVLGTALTSLLMLTVFALVLPWYVGVPWRSMLTRLSASVDALVALLMHGVERIGARSGRQRGRGAVRRADRTNRPVKRSPSVATPPEPKVEPPAATIVRSSPPLSRDARAREKVIREPWLLPKSARMAAPSPVAPGVRVMPATSASVPSASVAQKVDPSEFVAPPRVDELPANIESTAQKPPEPVEEAAWEEVEPPVVAQLAATSSIAPARRAAANDDQPVLTTSATVPSSVTAISRTRSNAMLPPLSLLAPARVEVTAIDEAQLAETSELIEQRLREFKVPVSVVGASAGPVITRFEVEPAVGVRGNQIVALMKDLARGLGRTSVRVVETIPGKTCMGLELPNEQRQMIALSEILDSSAYRRSDSLLTLAMGKGITGEPLVTDLAKAPHMLVAGTTGSGKSVAVNAMILSMLYKATPDDVRMIMIDPKMLELSVYEGIPHLLAPVVTDMKLAANALAWCVGEMESRYRLMSDLRVRNLAGYNQKILEAKASGRPLLNPFPAHPEVPETLDTLPMIVVVIDELADLMMVAGKKIEELIARLAQKARAAGIHLILATQRPSVDVITGLIKANIPTRVAFQVSSKIDSRTILDQMGAESLLGQGDMLFLPPGTGYPQRIHGAFVADEEVHRVVAHLKLYGEPDYREEILAGPPSEGTGELFGEEGGDAELDPLYDEAAAFVLRSRRASISFVQRQFRIGYNRAARLVEAMEAAGLVSSMGINGQREVIAPGPVD